MNSELGAFALRQVFASLAVLGPILILVGLCYFLFNQDRRSIILYIGGGLLLTVIGVICLYSELRTEDSRAQEREAELQQERADSLASESAQK